MERGYAVTTLAILLVVLGPWSCSQKMESINFGTVPTAASTLVYIAQDQHFFAANGLSVNIKGYATGHSYNRRVVEG